MLEVDKSTILLGNLKYGETYNFTYTIENTYSKDLSIERVYAGCAACTKVKVGKSNLSPGEKTSIDVSFIPGRVGRQTKSITIVSKTGSVLRPDLVLKFKSTVNG